MKKKNWEESPKKVLQLRRQCSFLFGGIVVPCLIQAVLLACRCHCNREEALEEQPEREACNSTGTSYYCVLITKILWGLLCYPVKSNNDGKRRVNLSVSSSCLQRNNWIAFLFSFRSQLFAIVFTQFSLSS